MHSLLLLIPLLLPSPAAAGAVHKCLGEDGVPSYQSQPCGPAQRTAWTRAATPGAAAPVRVVTAPPPPPPVRAAPAAARKVAVRRTQDPVARRCAAARRAADLTRDRLWNRLSFRQRSELDQKVAYACRR